MRPAARTMADPAISPGSFSLRSQDASYVPSASTRSRSRGRGRPGRGAWQLLALRGSSPLSHSATQPMTALARAAPSLRAAAAERARLQSSVQPKVATSVLRYRSNLRGRRDAKLTSFAGDLPAYPAPHVEHCQHALPHADSATARRRALRLRAAPRCARDAMQQAQPHQGAFAAQGPSDVRRRWTKLRRSPRAPTVRRPHP